jgi:tetratricopeptide (TPR) repeat protein
MKWIAPISMVFFGVFLAGPYFAQNPPWLRDPMPWFTGVATGVLFFVRNYRSMGEPAKQFYEAGEHAAQHNRNNTAGLTQAYGNFVAASYVDPTWGQAHYAVGNNACDLNMSYAAIAAYRRALECENSDVNLARIHCNLGWQLHIIGRTKEAFEHCMKAVELDPLLSFGWLNLSIVHYIMGNTETSVSCAMKANELLPGDPTAQIALAFALMHNRQMAEGLKYFEARFRYKLHQYLSFPFTRWKGESGRTIFIAADQGLGDTLSFARFVPEAASKSKFVHLCVQPELIRLFDQAFGHIKNLNVMPLNTPFPAYDHWTTFVSLPTALGLTNDEIINKAHFRYAAPPCATTGRFRIANSTSASLGRARR